MHVEGVSDDHNGLHVLRHGVFFSNPSNPQYLICTYDALTLMQAKYIRCTSKSLTATRQKYIRCTSPMSSILHQVCRIDAVHALDSILKRIWCTSNACATHLMHLWCKKNAVYVSLMCIWCTLQVNPLMYILCASVYAVYMQSIYMACVRNDDVLLTSYLPWEGFEPTICCFGVGHPTDWATRAWLSYHWQCAYK